MKIYKHTHFMSKYDELKEQITSRELFSISNFQAGVKLITPERNYTEFRAQLINNLLTQHLPLRYQLYKDGLIELNEDEGFIIVDKTTLLTAFDFVVSAIGSSELLQEILRSTYRIINIKKSGIHKDQRLQVEFNNLRKEIEENGVDIKLTINKTGTSLSDDNHATIQLKKDRWVLLIDLDGYFDPGEYIHEIFAIVVFDRARKYERNQRNIVNRIMDNNSEGAKTKQLKFRYMHLIRFSIPILDAIADGIGLEKFSFVHDEI